MRSAKANLFYPGTFVWQYPTPLASEPRGRKFITHESRRLRNMKLFIKVIRGNDCVIEATADTTILEIKKRIESVLKVPIAQQTLVYFGKTLVDDKTVAFYAKIQDGAKIHLVVKKPESLPVVLERFLRKYYSEEQTKQIIDEFMSDFHAKVKSLSLDDLEQIAINYLNEDAAK